MAKRRAENNAFCTASRKGIGKSHLPLIITGIILLSALQVFAQTSLNEWGSQIADRVEAYFPAPVTGLTERFPWDPQDFNRASKGWGCGETGCLYYPVDVTRKWRIADQTIVKEHESISNQEKEVERRAAEKGRRATQQEMMQIMTEAQQLAEKKTKLERSARFIEVRIRPNWSAEDRMGVKAKAAGNIKGYPFYRIPDTNGRDIILAAYVGPPGFRNPALSGGQKPKTEVKCILVEVQLYSTPSSVKSDEALARQMIEKIDYPGLAKLVKP